MTNETCSICGRGAHPNDDPECVAGAREIHRDAARWRYWRSVWFDIAVNYKPYRSITNAGDIESVESAIDAAIVATENEKL